MNLAFKMNTLQVHDHSGKSTGCLPDFMMLKIILIVIMVVMIITIILG